jgi:hypothetical protein
MIMIAFFISVLIPRKTPKDVFFNQPKNVTTIATVVTTPENAAHIERENLVIFILDSSGSMEEHKSTTIESYNKLLKENRHVTEDRAIFSLILFNCVLNLLLRGDHKLFNISIIINI